MSVYTVALPKGGSTKSTLAAELVAELARWQRRVLAIDLDRQADLTSRLGLNETVQAASADVLFGTATIEQAAAPAPSVPGAAVLAGTRALLDAEFRQEVIVSLRAMLPQLDGWDDVVIDTPTYLGTVTLAALAAADTITAPVVCQSEAYDQVDELTTVIAERVAPALHPGQQLHWIVPARYDRRRLLDRDVLDTLTDTFPGRVTTPIREAVAVGDAYTAAQPVSIYAPRSRVAADYQQALGTILTATGVAA